MRHSWAWISMNRKKQGVYPILRYGEGKVFTLGKLPEYDPVGLLVLVLGATKRTRSIKVLTALRDVNKNMRY